MSPKLALRLFDLLGTGVLVLDGRRRIMTANPAACRMLRSSQHELTGQSLLEATLCYELHQAASASEQAGQTQELEVVYGSGASRLHASITPLDSSVDLWSGSPAFILVLLTDVTEMRRLEMVRRDFVANLSHELRTPLASIRALSETLQGGALADPDASKRFVGLIQQEVVRLTRMLEDLLTLSRAESASVDVDPLRLDLIAADCVHRYRSRAQVNGVELECFVAEPVLVEANAEQMEQVLNNLLDNAGKYTGRGGRVTVRVERSGCLASLQVSDTGIGILSEDLPRIFERFYRADRARSRQSGGAGLGLAIVKHIVESHGGSVSAESSYGRGARFTVLLPMLEEAG